ncbi:MAG: aminotransferase class V-fold PLP-dependent enzyme [Opitutales bacterium]|nr:aminotransferase class V-fold PLP-dependent enzyme [Opitutales bacterium]
MTPDISALARSKVDKSAYIWEFERVQTFTFTEPRFPRRREDVLDAAMTALREKPWARLEGVPETEAALKSFHGGGLPWFISSGTASLMALLLGHEIGPGDEVITTPYTWGATISAILTVGAIPVFADIQRENALLDPATVEAKISPKTKAVLCVHLFGHACDMTKLRTITRKHGLLLFEDGSQAHGAKWQDRVVGLEGDGAAFSCMGMKLLAGTEGGYALFTKPDPLEKASLYGKHPRGMSADRVAVLQEQGLLDALQLGWRPCVVSAALVKANLPYLNGEITARRSNAQRLRENLKGQKAVCLPEEETGATGCYHLLSLVFDPAEGAPPRAVVHGRLQKAGLGGFIYIPTPMHRLKRLNPHEYEGPRVFWHEALRQAGVDYRETHCPAAEWRSEHSLEFSFNWTEEAPEAMDQMAEILLESVKS